MEGKVEGQKLICISLSNNIYERERMGRGKPIMLFSLMVWQDTYANAISRTVTLTAAWNHAAESTHGGSLIQCPHFKGKEMQVQGSEMTYPRRYNQMRQSPNPGVFP